MESKDETQQVYDVVIVGAGVAGLYTALQLPEHIRVLVLAKDSKTVSNTNLAQGGIAGVFHANGDSPEMHYQDTMVAGRFTNDKDAVRVLTNEAHIDLENLISYGMPFDKNEQGELDRTIEGGHSKRRVYHAKDKSGEKLLQTLLHTASHHTNITLIQYAQVVTAEKTPHGFFTYILQKGSIQPVFSSVIVLATGGVGQTYTYTTNVKTATGDGIRIADELGAELKDMHLVQFHPTAFHKTGSATFLISESLRGEGGLLLNANGERFMTHYHKHAELAPRDVISKAMLNEATRSGSDSFFLDMTHMKKGYVKERFPSIYKKCMDEGVDIEQEPIPVYPCQHYIMGGVYVDLSSKTNVDGLYAVGECSCTGVHGENRLASNSLLEALVWGRRCAKDIEKLFVPLHHSSIPKSTKEFAMQGKEVPSELAGIIQEEMQNAFFVVPNIDKAKTALLKIEQIEQTIQTGFAITQRYCDTLSMATTAKKILTKVVEN